MYGVDAAVKDIRLAEKVMHNVFAKNTSIYHDFQ